MSNSIAVLPFDDMSPDKDQAYFAEGIAEEILNTLAQLNELKVAGRTSSFSLKEKDLTIEEIGKTLNVNHVLEGSVRKQGNQIRITAQLIKVDDGFHIWSKKYDRDLDDIFAIQDELAQSIGEVLLEKLAPEQIEKLKTNLPRNSQAYDLFLSAKHIHWNVYRSGGAKQKDFEKSERLFLEAITLDSTYALAYAGLADLYDTYLGFNLRTAGDSLGIKKYEELSKKASEKAIRLNPELSYVNSVRGYVYLFQEKNYREAFKSLLKGYQISPNNPDALIGLQFFYKQIGLLYDAAQVGNRLKEIDPLFQTGLVENLITNRRLGNVEQVIEDGQFLLDLDPNNMIALSELFRNYFEANRKTEALEMLKKMSQIDSTYKEKYLPKLWCALVEDNTEFVTEKLKEGTHGQKFIIHHFYGEDDLAEKELRLAVEKDNPIDSTTEITIRNSFYLTSINNKRSEKYINKDWFQKALEPRKKIYEYTRSQFPKAEEILIY